MVAVTVISSGDGVMSNVKVATISVALSVADEFALNDV